MCKGFEMKENNLFAWVFTKMKKICLHTNICFVDYYWTFLKTEQSTVALWVMNP